MSGNTLGEVFRITTFGESHGKAVGVVIDGIKPNIPITKEIIQKELDRRRPGQSSITTPRNEKDEVEIISGVFEGKTTGTPVCLIIRNQDQNPQIYEKYKNIFRPGHAGYTFIKKFGIYDYRGGGRASGRETAGRVAAGAIAKKILKDLGIDIIAYTSQVGTIKSKELDFNEIEANPIRCPDKEAADKMINYITKLKNSGDSVGGVVEIIIKNCPPGLGEPVFDKLNADLGKALLSIGAVKGVEFGIGFKSATKTGSKYIDEFIYSEESEKIRTKTNNQGGILGGMSDGEDITCRIAIKPPASILKKKSTITHDNKSIKIAIEGRHDPCLCPRIVPVAESMVALVILDKIMMQENYKNPSKLIELRDSIDIIDKNILYLLKLRNNLSKKVGDFKRERGLPVFDKVREDKLLRNKKRLAEELDINTKFIENLYNLIIKDSRGLQK